jgi:hypothetical protein
MQIGDFVWIVTRGIGSADFVDFWSEVKMFLSGAFCVRNVFEWLSIEFAHFFEHF